MASGSNTSSNNLTVQNTQRVVHIQSIPQITIPKDINKALDNGDDDKGGNGGRAMRGLHDVHGLNISATVTVRKLSGILRRAYYKELVVYFVFLGTFFAAAFLIAPVHLPFMQFGALEDLLFEEEFNRTQSHIKKTFYDVMVEEEFWQWVNHPLRDGLLSPDWDIPNNICANSTTTTGCECNTPLLHCQVQHDKGPEDCIFQEHFLNRVNRLVGPIRFRQLRAQISECDGTTNNEALFKCRRKVFDKTPFGQNCNLTNISPDSCYPYTENVGWKPFRPELDPGYFDLGYYVTDGGFVVDIFPTLAHFDQTVERLQSDFIDSFTYVIEISFNIYNSNTNILHSINALFVFDRSGYIDKNFRILPIQLDPYGSDFSNKVFWQCVFVAFIVHFVWEEIKEFRLIGWGYFHDFWNLVEWISLSLSICLIGFWCQYIKALDNLSFDTEQRCEFQNTVNTARLMMLAYAICGVTMIFALVKVNKFLKFNNRLHVLWRTLLNASTDILAFMMIFLLIFLGFALWAHYVFGPFMVDYHTLGASCSSLFRMMLGDLDYREMVLRNPFLAPVFVAIYGMTIIFIVVNVFISIVSEWYQYSKLLLLREKRNRPAVEDAVDYDVLKQLRRWWFFFRAFRIGSTTQGSHIVLRKNQLYELVFDKPETEADQFRAAVISTHLFTYVKQPETRILLSSGVVFSVVSASAESRRITCRVEHPGSFQSFERVWVDKNALTFPGLPAILLRVSWRTQSLLRTLSHSLFSSPTNTKRHRSTHVSWFSRSSTTLSAMRRSVQVKNKLDFKFTIEVPFLDWGGDVYTTSQGKFPFTLKDLLIVMRKYVNEQDTEEPNVQLGFHRLIDLLFNHSIERAKRPSFRDILGAIKKRFIKLVFPRSSIHPARSRVSGQPVAPPQRIELVLCCPNPDIFNDDGTDDEEKPEVLQFVTHIDSSKYGPFFIDMAELAFVIMLRFGSLPGVQSSRTRMRHSSSFNTPLLEPRARAGPNAIIDDQNDTSTNPTTNTDTNTDTNTSVGDHSTSPMIKPGHTSSHEDSTSQSTPARASSSKKRRTPQRDPTALKIHVGDLDDDQDDDDDASTTDNDSLPSLGRVNTAENGQAKEGSSRSLFDAVDVAAVHSHAQVAKLSSEVHVLNKKIDELTVLIKTMASNNNNGSTATRKRLTDNQVLSSRTLLFS